jgi:hypothetical protein
VAQPAFRLDWGLRPNRMMWMKFIMARRCSAYFTRTRIQMNRVLLAANDPVRLAVTLLPALPIVQPAASGDEDR